MATTHLPQFVIAERHTGTPWPNSGEEGRAIIVARNDYEQGAIEMAHRREGHKEYLYAIPRRFAGTKRPGYFTREIT